MSNLIEILRKFVKENTDVEDKSDLMYVDKNVSISYRDAEFLIETIESLETSCNEANKYYEMIMDYNRLLKQENDDLRNKLYGQF